MITTRCDKCDYVIDQEEQTYCFSCINDLEIDLLDAQERIQELEEKLDEMINVTEKG